MASREQERGPKIQRGVMAQAVRLQERVKEVIAASDGVVVVLIPKVSTTRCPTDCHSLGLSLAHRRQTSPAAGEETAIKR